jgi:hypothetical protein
MVYMGVKVMACSGTYSDGVKASVAVGVRHWLTPPNRLWCIVDVM